VERVRRARFDLVFNLCEGIDGVASLEPVVISVLELFGIPYTGSSSTTTALCLRKNVVNTLLDRARLPVPRWTLARRGVDVASVGYPSICKPAAEDASIGIEQRSVVRSTRALTARVEAMHERWEEILVQRYIDPTAREGPPGNRQARTIEERVDDVLAKTDRGGSARISGVGNAEQLEYRDHQRLERRNAIDSLAEVEYQIESCAAHTFHPPAVRVDRHTDVVMAPVRDGIFNRFDRPEDQQVGLGTER